MKGIYIDMTWLNKREQYEKINDNCEILPDVMADNGNLCILAVGIGLTPSVSVVTCLLLIEGIWFSLVCKTPTFLLASAAVSAWILRGRPGLLSGGANGTAFDPTVGMIVALGLEKLVGVTTWKFFVGVSTKLVWLDGEEYVLGI